MEIIKGYIYVCAFMILVLSISTLVKIHLKVNNNIPRKIVHIGTAFSWFIIYKYFGTTIHMLFVPTVILIVNLCSNRLNIFSKVPLLTNNRDKGTYLYPLSMLIMSIITIINPDYYIAYGVGLFSMALGDGFASIIGNSFKSKEFRIFGAKKTIYGCLTVFLFTSIAAYTFPMMAGQQINIAATCFIGVSGMFLEILGGRSLDNITLPLIVSFLAYLAMMI